MDSSRTCPAWCADDIPTDLGGVIHLSVSHGLTAGFEVSIERLDAGSPGSAAIRLHAGTGELSPLGAFELANALQAAAAAALLEAETSR